MHDLRLFSCAFALLCLVSATAQQENQYSLTVKLKPQYDPRPTVCILIRTGELFETVVDMGKTKTFISGKLQDAKNQLFPLELDISQDDKERSIFDSRTYELRLGIPAAYFIHQERSNHPQGYDREVRLTRGTCPVT